MSKSDTMLSILWLLRSGRKLTAKELADELEVHVRTIYRCIDSLCASGAPIMAESGPNGGYQMIGQFSNAPLLFDMEEQKALAQASLFAEAAGYPLTSALGSAIAKLKRYTNEDQLAHIDRSRTGLTVIAAPSYADDNRILRELEKASAQGFVVRMTYDKGKGSAPESREFEPYSIVHWKGSWYTAGFCRLRRSLRSFRVDRIMELDLTDARFERPADFSAKEVLMGQLLPGAIQAERLVDLRIRAPEQALNELQKHWLFGHALHERTDGEALFRMGESALFSYVPYYLMPYGKALTIVEPISLIEKLVQTSEGIANHYKEMRRQANERKDDEDEQIFHDRQINRAARQTGGAGGHSAPGGGRDEG
ncbi:helix-turn-helix transcriptional regulator [Paenibacillus soyae]|uniref:WYL domain-containing protein n=1 Tax=Paenibacillus soyae TaxID=2969249 RepID=A0A9X2SAK7_9BACL|nr:WYL domain-containing protein [Paenibacillus soyae]MCR2806421.1 WYL domain-containing protein [Paenibacillus soyae]